MLFLLAAGNLKENQSFVRVAASGVLATWKHRVVPTVIDAFYFVYFRIYVSIYFVVTTKAHKRCFNHLEAISCFACRPVC